MTSEDELGQVLGNLSSDKDDIKRNFGSGSLLNYIYSFQENALIADSVGVKTRSIAGDALIWGNSLFGIWGTGKWRSAANESFVLGNTAAAVLGEDLLGFRSSEWVFHASGTF